ncbi:MAG: hypothetical protein V4655_14285 [Bdellovibrionota bacterium]
MEPMSKSELQSLDDEMLLGWLDALSRYRAEDIGLHIDPHGHFLFGEIRPTLEEVQDELVRRGLDSRPGEVRSDRSNREDVSVHP